MTTARWTCVILLAAMPLGPAALGAIAEADRAAAAETVEKMFGSQIRQVKATADKADDLETAGVLLQASGEVKTALAIRAELARTAMELAAPIGTDKASAFAAEALTRWSALAGMSRIERGKCLVSIRQGELDKATGERKSQAARQLVEAAAELGESYEAANDLDSAAAQIFRALSVARGARLTDVVEELTAANMRLQRIRSFRRAVEAAEKELAAAEAGGNAPLVQTTVAKIGLLHLLRNGDPASAAEHLAKVKHPWAAAAADIRRRASGARLSVEGALAAAEMLHSAAGRAEIGAKVPLLELLLDLCAEMAATMPADDQAARVAMLRKQAEDMLARLPNPGLLRLRRALAKLAGKVVWNPDGTIQLTYRFSSKQELSDFSPTTGNWTAGGGALAAGKGGGSVYHNVRFRADRPLHVSFAGAGGGGAIAVLALNDDLRNYRNNAHFCAGFQGGRLWYLGGLRASYARGPMPSGPEAHLVHILHDGAGRFTYIIHGQAVGKLQTQQRLLGGGFRVGFEIPANRPATVANLSIVGVPLAQDPVAKSAPSAAAPAQQPPGPAPPDRSRRPPGRRRSQR